MCKDLIPSKWFVKSVNLSSFVQEAAWNLWVFFVFHSSQIDLIYGWILKGFNLLLWVGKKFFKNWNFVRNYGKYYSEFDDVSMIKENLLEKPRHVQACNSSTDVEKSRFHPITHWSLSKLEVFLSVKFSWTVLSSWNAAKTMKLQISAVFFHEICLASLWKCEGYFCYVFYEIIIKLLGIYSYMTWHSSGNPV